MGRIIVGETEWQSITKIQRSDEQAVGVPAGQGEGVPAGAEAAEAEIQERIGAVAARAGDGVVGAQSHAHLHPLIPTISCK